MPYLRFPAESLLPKSAQFPERFFLRESATPKFLDLQSEPIKSAKICENVRSGSGFSLLLSPFWCALTTSLGLPPPGALQKEPGAWRQEKRLRGRERSAGLRKGPTVAMGGWGGPSRGHLGLEPTSGGSRQMAMSELCCPCPPRGPENSRNSSRSKVSPKVGFRGLPESEVKPNKELGLYF